MNRTQVSFSQIDRSILLTLCVGLLVRLLLMPLSANSDLMSTYWAAHLVAFHNKSAGFQTLIRYFHAGYLKLVTPMLPLADSIWIHRADDSLLNPFVSILDVSIQGWFEFVSQPQIYRTLLLLKLPYLGFDLGCAYLLYRLGSDQTKSRYMFIFWWLNPILIFSVYVFGRHEVIALFFIILSIFWIKQDKRYRGLLALGVAIALRYYAVFLLPFFVFSLDNSWKKRIRGIILGLIPWLAMNLAGWIFVGSIEAVELIGLPQDQYLLSMKFEIAAWDNLYIFPLVYFLLVLHRLYNRKMGLQSLVQYSLIAMLLLFATAYTGQSPHYWTWLLPLLTIATVENRQLLPLHMVQILLLITYSFIGGRSTAGYLFAPVSPEFFWSLPSPIEVLERFASSEMVISLARTAFSAVSLWMAYLVFRQLKSTFFVNSGSEEIT